MKTSLKQILTLTLAVAFAFTLTHCSDNGGDGDSSKKDDETGATLSPDGSMGPGLDDATHHDVAYYKEFAACTGRVIDKITRQGIPGATVELITAYVVESAEPSYIGSKKPGPIVSPEDKTGKEEKVDTKKKAPFAKKALPFDDPFADPKKDVPLAPTTIEPQIKDTKVTKTHVDDPSTIIDETGTYRLKDLPSDFKADILITANGYASRKIICATSNVEVEGFHATNNGEIEMGPAKDKTVAVTQNGEAPVGANCHVYAELEHDPYSFEHVGKVVNGETILKGLDATESYYFHAGPCDGYAKVTKKVDLVKATDTITIAMDTAANNVPFYVSSINGVIMTGKGLQFDEDGDGKNEVDEKAMRPGATVTIYGNAAAGAVAEGKESMKDVFAMLPNGSLVATFSQPIQMVGEYHLTSKNWLEDDFWDDLEEDLEDQNYTKINTVSLSCSLSASNTKITCVPQIPLKTNIAYKWEGVVQANIPDVTEDSVKQEPIKMHNLNFNQGGDTDYWVVTDDTATGLPAIAAAKDKPITADNYDGTGDDDTGEGVAASATWLEFPELVYGTWEVKQYVVHKDVEGEDKATVLEADACHGELLDAAGQLVREGNISGCSNDDENCNEPGDNSGKRYYRVPMNCALVKTGGTVTVDINATDANGNVLQGEYTFNVQ